MSAFTELEPLAVNLDVVIFSFSSSGRFMVDNFFIM